MFRSRARRAAAALIAFALAAQTARAQAPAMNDLTSALGISQLSAYETAVAYVATFYPLWFTYLQSLRSKPDELVGPKQVTPSYHVVVAINVDTIYASSFLDVSTQPAILTVPPSEVTFSALVLDPYGNISSALPSNPAPGVYALIGPRGYSGTLPPGATPITLPVNNPTIIFRADKYSADGVDQTQAATDFRASLRLQSLTDYEKNPGGGATKNPPQAVFAVPVKTVADGLIAVDPIAFLDSLVVAVDDKRTPPLTPGEAMLSARMEALLGSGGSREALAAGTQTAHALILGDYLGNRGATNWITFTNIGHWTASEVLDRAAITEYLQFGNDRAAAGYYHVFTDGEGQPLDGSITGGYELTFPAGSIPAVKRFWSLTAYTPQSIELVPNNLDKYNIASYTPGLTNNSDGSLTLYFGTSQPEGVPAANFLPIPPRRFNLMLRFYGPEPGGSVATNTYVPPPVMRRD